MTVEKVHPFSTVLQGPIPAGPTNESCPKAEMSPKYRLLIIRVPSPHLTLADGAAAHRGGAGRTGPNGAAQPNLINYEAVVRKVPINYGPIVEPQHPSSSARSFAFADSTDRTSVLSQFGQVPFNHAGRPVTRSLAASSVACWWRMDWLDINGFSNVRKDFKRRAIPPCNFHFLFN